VVPLEYDYVHSFSDGIAWVEKDGKYGCIDKNGKVVVVPLEYDYVHSFNDGIAFLLSCFCGCLFRYIKTPLVFTSGGIFDMVMGFLLYLTIVS
jgi:hypothetical protein